MRHHHTFFGKIFGTAWDAIKDVFSGTKEAAQELAVKITEVVKNALDSKAAEYILDLIPGDIDDKVAAFLKEKIPFLLTQLLLAKDLQEADTTEEAEDLGQRIIDAFGGLDNKQREKFITSFAAEVLIFLKEHEGQKITWGMAAKEVQTAYELWVKSKENEDTSDSTSA